ncbi:MAG: winged helix-turn-helix domain-containing protein [Chloroflexales bacterium]|nr:winged helix-turn-helix domain-containing protein [Chloroflexales bacterium]
MYSNSNALIFAPKLVAPQAARTWYRQPILARAADRPVALFTGADSYLLKDSLAATLKESGRPVVWLRLGPEDRDPATFLITLGAGLDRVCPGVSDSLLERMRRRPGPTMGWPPLFAYVAHEIAESLPDQTALVLEHSHYLEMAHPVIGLLCSSVLPRLPDGTSCILTAQQRLADADWPDTMEQYGSRHLRLDARSAHEWLVQTGQSLAPACLRRFIALTDGRAVALTGLTEAIGLLGDAAVRRVVDAASGADDLFARLANAMLATVSLVDRDALALALSVEYCHPDLIATALNGGALPLGPWFQQLAEDWLLVSSLWQAPLRLVLRSTALPRARALHSAADYLVKQGSVEHAVKIHMAAENFDAAAQTLAAASEAMMSLGQWATIDEWLTRLPASALRNSPWLVYAGGEIAAARGDIVSARHGFAKSSKLFMDCHDSYGACQSVLAESVLATWEGNYAEAIVKARAANALALSSQLLWNQSWASWYLGCLLANAGDFDAALGHFATAAAAISATGDAVMIELVRLTEELTLHQRDLREQRELHRQAYFATERAERELAERLHRSFTTPLDRLDTLLNVHGWSRTPLMLKLSSIPVAGAPSDAVARTGLWGVLLHLVGLRRPKRAATVAPAEGHPPAEPPLLALTHEYMPSAAPLAAQVGAVAVELADTQAVSPPNEWRTIRSIVPMSLSDGAAQSAAPDIAKPRDEHKIAAYMLGEFRVLVNDRPVKNWPSGRGRSVFKYLLTHHNRPVSRDVLMDVFWPDAEPEAARNSLNVAMHGLRQALRPVTDVAVVLFQQGAYQLSPDLRLWIDIDEFERRVREGHACEERGQLAAAVAEYEVVTSLYQGDFLVDDPYDDWPVLIRERLRTAYLDTLDRLAHTYFSQGQYGQCAALCQIILAHDNCREDAHCKLMRCYSRQGQQYLALRQYQACAEALRDELNIDPSPSTTQLYERIRQHAQV